MQPNIDEVKKVFDNHGYFINSIIIDILKKFKFRTILYKTGAQKKDGYSVSEILSILLMLPLMVLKSVHSLYKSKYNELSEMKKDTIYRLMNNEKMPWRRMLYSVCKRFQNLVNPNKEVAPNSAFIIDDTPDMRVGYKIEKISRVHDHVTGKTGLGFKMLFFGLFDGQSFNPLDFSIHSEKKLELKKRKNQFNKECIPNSNGYKRRKECLVKKTTNALLMIKRAIKNGFTARYTLVDSWFGSKGFIKAVREIKAGAMDIICGIRRDKRKYEYEGDSFNAKQLIKKLRKEKKQKRCRKWNVRYFEVTVNYDGIGNVKLYICRFPFQKKWRIFLSTDTELTFVKMMEIYSVRWSIEVFFKEAKQHLMLGKCQSRDFDAQIANTTIACILYIFLSYYRRVNDYETIGVLFEVIKNEICEKNIAQRLWQLFDELLQVIVSSITKLAPFNISRFRDSQEYLFVKSLFERSFLAYQIMGINKA